MSSFWLSNNTDINQIKTLIENDFPDVKVSISGKKNILIIRKHLMLVLTLKKKCVKLSGDLNYRNRMIMIYIIIGILLGFIGVGVILITLYIRYYSQIKSFKLQMAGFIEQRIA